ncbi:hypothetical protein AALP_AA6G254600 [Arabis alpina]|uniref:Uncharacterized protein n=1 Tax=Arabis alpina TaxID=50452 RepID=A0A087GRM3_ARAAL|nr:hypothetical protein AALP_AA6G254600 [Arabis alpina]
MNLQEILARAKELALAAGGGEVRQCRWICGLWRWRAEMQETYLVVDLAVLVEEGSAGSDLTNRGGGPMSSLGPKVPETWIDQKSNLAASAMEDGIVLKPIGYGGEEMDCWNGGSLSLVAQVKLVVQIREDPVADPVDLAIPAVVEVRMASREAGLVALEGDQSR